MIKNLFLPFMLVVFVSTTLTSLASSEGTRVKNRTERPIGYKHQKTVSDGEGLNLPKTFLLYPYIVKGKILSLGESKSSLRINKQGLANIGLLAPFKSLKDLNKKNIVRVFGEPSLQSIIEKGQTFHLFAPSPTGPNIYHIDTKFNRKNQLVSIRIRGYLIETPIWTAL